MQVRQDWFLELFTSNSESWLKSITSCVTLMSPVGVLRFCFKIAKKKKKKVLISTLQGFRLLIMCVKCIEPCWHLALPHVRVIVIVNNNHREFPLILGLSSLYIQSRTYKSEEK